jgi:hypothetical protein
MTRRAGDQGQDPRYGADKQGLMVYVTFEPSYTAAGCVAQAYEQVVPLIQRTLPATTRTTRRQTLARPSASVPRLRREAGR